MKLHLSIASLLATLVLSAAEPPKSLELDRSVKIMVSGDGTLSVSAGTLGEIVQAFEGAPVREGSDKSKQGMPNIIFGAGAAEAKLPADVRLRHVTNVQALALIAKAADCYLEPIVAPYEETSGESGKPKDAQPPVIGYQISRNGTRPEKNDAYATAKVNTSKMDQAKQGVLGIKVVPGKPGLVVDELLPDGPAARSKTVKKGDKIFFLKEADGAELTLDGLPPEQAVTKMRGAPGSKVTLQLGEALDSKPTKTVELQREVLDPRNETSGNLKELTFDYQLGQSKPEVLSISPSSGTSSQLSAQRARTNELIYGLKVPTEFTVKTNESATSSTYGVLAAGVDEASKTGKTKDAPLVKVYALGTLIDGDLEQAERKQKELQDLMEVTMSKSGMNGRPEVFIHQGTKALVIKGTAEQQGFVREIISALLESESLRAKARQQ